MYVYIYIYIYIYIISSSMHSPAAPPPQSAARSSALASQVLFVTLVYFRCICVCVHIYIYIYIHTHTYIIKHIISLRLVQLLICCIKFSSIYIYIYIYIISPRQPLYKLLTASSGSSINGNKHIHDSNARGLLTNKTRMPALQGSELQVRFTGQAPTDV